MPLKRIKRPREYSIQIISLIFIKICENLITFILREAIIIQNRSKLGNHPIGGGGLGFYLVFPNLEVGKWFLLGGVSKSTR